MIRGNDMIKVGKTRKHDAKVNRRLAFSRRVLLVFIVLVVVIAVAVTGLLRKTSGISGSSNPKIGSFTVKRGDLTISVTESGSIKAVKTVDIQSEVEGQVSIVNIVPEGTFITPEDVNDGKVLVELDSSKLKDQLSQMEIELTTAEATYADANESHLIQLKQNESDVTAGQLKVKFTLMDFQKYLGKTTAQKVLANADADPNSSIDVASLLEDPNSLGGEASQKLRELTGDITLAKSNLEKAAYTLEWTEKLYAKQFVAETELRKDRLDKQRIEIEEKKAKTALTLFQLYEFAKQSEQLLSDYSESQRELDRTKARAQNWLRPRHGLQAQNPHSTCRSSVSKS